MYNSYAFIYEFVFYAIIKQCDCGLYAVYFLVRSAAKYILLHCLIRNECIYLLLSYLMYYIKPRVCVISPFTRPHFFLFTEPFRGYGLKTYISFVCVYARAISIYIYIINRKHIRAAVRMRHEMHTVDVVAHSPERIARFLYSFVVGLYDSPIIYVYKHDRNIYLATKHIYTPYACPGDDDDHGLNAGCLCGVYI